MVKEYFIKGLDCAHCAAKIEKELSKIEIINDLKLNFIAKKLSFNADEDKINEALNIIKKITNKIEAGVEYIEKEDDESHEHCDSHSVHEHHDHEHCDCDKEHIQKHHHHKSEQIHKGNNHPLARKENEAKIDENTIMLGRIVFSIFMFVIALIVSSVSGFASTSFALISYFIIAYDIVIGAIKGVIKGKLLDEKFLMTIASIGALLIGEMLEGIAVMVLYQVGELFQKRAVNHSKKSITHLVGLKPDFARLKRIKGEKKERPSKVNIGEIIVVKPGEKIPLDGQIIKGSSSIDTSIMTGESRPLDVYEGDHVTSGTINLSSVLEIKVTTLYKDSNVMKILNLVENASANKSKSEKFITKFAYYYTPIVVFLAILISLTSSLFFDRELIDSIYTGLSFLVVSCPCALVISIPLAYFSGIGRASKDGILIKGGNHLETLSNVNEFIFDKTGTLTKGEFKVSKIYSLIEEEKFIAYAASLEKNFNHPIAKSINTFYQKETFVVENVLDMPGYGVKGYINGDCVLLGNQKLMDKEEIEIAPNDEIDTTIYLAINSKYVGYIVISDTVKEESFEMISTLKLLNIQKTTILSGDNEEIVKKIQSELKVDKVYSSLNPDDKLKVLQTEIDNNKKSKKIAYVGDGVNDAPSLALADVGIAMGGLGSDAAIESSDIVIMDDNPLKICKLIKLAKKVKTIVLQNIIFALLIKVTVMALVSFNLVTMWMAIFADVGVALLAILNSIRLLKQKI